MDTNEVKAWVYVEPGPDMNPVEITFTREQIIQVYFPYWCARMRGAGKADKISEERCIEDWVAIHWAFPAKEA